MAERQYGWSTIGEDLNKGDERGRMVWLRWHILTSPNCISPSAPAYEVSGQYGAQFKPSVLFSFPTRNLIYVGKFTISDWPDQRCTLADDPFLPHVASGSRIFSAPAQPSGKAQHGESLMVIPPLRAKTTSHTLFLNLQPSSSPTHFTRRHEVHLHCHRIVW